MRTAQLGVVASLGFGVFAQGGGWDIKPQPWITSQSNGWDIKRQPWSSSTQQWSESGQWSEQWKWTANQQLPAAPGSAWQFSQSNTVAPPLPAGASSSGKWTWIPAPTSGGFYWSYSSSSSSSPSSSSQGLGPAPGTPWQFSQSNTAPPPLPAGQSNGSWKWISGPSGGYYWSFIPGPKQDLPPPPGTAWQFSQSNSVAPPLPAGSTSGTWKWISAPSGGGYYWSFIAGPKQNLPAAPGTPWIFSTSSTTAPPLPAGVSGSGTWKWVSSPDENGYFWSFIPSGKQPATQQKLPDPPTGGSGWIFSSSSTTPPPLPAGASTSGTWKWVSAPNGNGYYWSYISSPQSPQQQLPPPQSGSTEWIFSPSKTTPPALPAGISGTAGTWKWVSAPTGNGYYWSFTPSSQQLPATKPGSTGWVFSPSNKEPPTISGISGSGSWTWVYSQSGNGYYWSWTPGAPQSIPAGFQGGFVTPDSGTTGQQGQGTKPSTGSGGSFDTKPSTGTGFGGSFDRKPDTQGGNIPGQPDQTSGGVSFQPGHQGGSFQQGGGQPSTGGFDQTKPETGGSGNVPTQGGNIPHGGGQPQTGDQPIKGPFGGSFDQTGRPVTGGDIPTQGGTGNVPSQGGNVPQGGSQGQAPVKGPFGGSFDQSGRPVTGGDLPAQQGTQGGTGNIPTQGGDIPQGGTQPQTGDQGQVPIKGPFGGSFDQSGKPITGGVPSGGTQGSGNVPIQGGTQPGDQGQAPIKGPFGGSFDQTGKPITGDVPSGGTHGTGNIPIQGGDVPQGGTQGTGTGSQPQTGDSGQIPIKGPFGGSFDHTGKPIDTSGQQGTGGSSTGDQSSQQPSEQGQQPIKGPFGGSFDHTGKPVDTTTGQQSTGGVPVSPSTGDQQTQQPSEQGQQPIKGPFGGSFDQSSRPIEAGGSTSGSHSSGNIPIQQPGQTGDQTSQNPQTGGTGSIPSSSGDTGVIKGSFGGSFDQSGRPVDTTKPVEGGGSTSGSHESGGVPVQQPGETGQTPLNPDGSHPSAGGEDVVKGPFGGSFDSTGKPVDVSKGSQGTYKCPPRSRIELLDAPTVPEAVCPTSQDRRYAVGPDKSFYILCCRHVDGGKKEITVIPDVPSLQYCIHICAGTPNCKSVLYTARQGSNSKYPIKTCQLFEHGNYDVQTPCNNDAHDSAYLIEPPTSTTGEIPPQPPVQVDPPISPPPISTPDVVPPQRPIAVDVPPSFIMLPPGISEQCVQNVFAAIRCGTCAGC
ncbi:hypothetical protein ONS96_006417 [Cadophora gregata f. sp. sojae]|nr:hypothetical protein ONS96_006417 [Cadophora gregata f. sp. sojae]